VIETTSRKTRRKGTVQKPELYARLGVREYFLFDPHEEYLDPPLQGYHRVGRQQRRQPPGYGRGQEESKKEQRGPAGRDLVGMCRG
jgi:Uma2 family endonuclease